MENLVTIIKITGTYRLGGEVKGLIFFKDLDFLRGEKVIANSPKGEKKLLTIKEIKIMHGEKCIILFEEVGDKIEASKLNNWNILVKRELVDLKDDEYLLSDLLGMEAIGEGGDSLGLIKDVFETAAHEIYVVGEGKDELMVPAVPDFVQKIDFKERKIYLQNDCELR